MNVRAHILPYSRLSVPNLKVVKSLISPKAHKKDPLSNLIASLYESEKNGTNLPPIVPTRPPRKNRVKHIGRFKPRLQKGEDETSKLVKKAKLSQEGSENAGSCSETELFKDCSNVIKVEVKKPEPVHPKKRKLRRSSVSPKTATDYELSCIKGALKEIIRENDYRKAGYESKLGKPVLQRCLIVSNPSAELKESLAQSYHAKQLLITYNEMQECRKTER
eukprot:TRINITY_DN121401_c0_g1_i1.p1 TRINITY_DN121401_c0_g1~~TRINITY_DN121401_c0_g1_i1.p1  ORF type:complete len:247 (+),score=8.61 TRINITY_DN121401_c0_g1_i1:83-742(+)